MFETLDRDENFTMLAVETPKASVPSSRRVAKLNGDRHVPVKSNDHKETHSRNFVRKNVEAVEGLRDLAPRRSIQRGGTYVQKKPKISSQFDLPEKLPRKNAQPMTRSARREYHPVSSLPAGTNSNILGVEDMLLLKKTRVKPKIGVLKDAPDSLPSRVRQSSDRIGGSKDLYGNMVIPERPKSRLGHSNGLIPENVGFERHVRDSTSYIDYTTSSKEEEELARRRLLSAARPKSAGQAMYMKDDMSDSDDSFYDGEIEIVDLDDPVFAYEREFEESKNSGKSNRKAIEPIDSTEKEFISNGITGYLDNTENISKQTHGTSESGSGLHRENSQSDYYDSYSIPRPPTSRGRRRAQSEPEVESLTVVRKKETRKSKQPSNVDRRLYQPLVRDSLYTTPVDKVINKYSTLSVQKRNSKLSNPVFIPRSDTEIVRAPLPRKLKPILRRDREKVGQTRNTIDYQISH